MTRSDTWKKRPAVLRYRAFRDEVRMLGVKIPVPASITFWMPMPESWSQKKRTAMLHQPHCQKPDIDNCVKALLDAVFEDDSHVWKITAEKRWAAVPGITVVAS